jgi:peptidyl-prolyl cis-trans isomerase C
MPTATAIPPTPTSLPMAIRVNGEGILISDYEEEGKRFEAARQTLGKTITPEESKTRVQEDLIGFELLSQAAKKSGYTVSQADIDAYLAKLTQLLGGADGMNTWLQANSYTAESFRRSLVRSLAAAWQRDQILKSMPGTAEQVHARQIFFSREESANNYRQKVDNGSDFAALANEADPITHGDLGWFPKGYLLQPEVEEAAFKLQPGEVSQVIKSSIGYHLIQVIEKDPAHQLSPDAKTVKESQTIADWVKQAKSEAKIEILIP